MNNGFDIAELVEKARSGSTVAVSVATADEKQTSEDASLLEFRSIFEQDLGINRDFEVEAAASRSNPEQASTPDPNDAFFGARNPAYVIQEEKPQHRVICYLAAEGNTRNEIAEKTGFSPVTIGYVLKQNWAQKRIAELIRQHGGDQVESALKGAVLDCAHLLIGTVKDKEVDIRVRSANAKEILDRVYGRSQQVIAHVNVTPEDLSDEELAKHLPKTEGTGNN